MRGIRSESGEEARLSSMMTGAGLGIVLFLFLTLLLSGITMLFGGILEAWIPIVALLGGIVTSYYIGRVKGVLLMIISLLVPLMLALLTFDTATDSLGYHEITIDHLLSGWNYIQAPMKPESEWVRHYARAQELMSAALISLIELTEAGKAVNAMYMFGALCLSYSFIRSLWPGLRHIEALISSCVLIFNPVCISQVLTFYNDLFLYPGLVVTALALGSEYRGVGSGKNYGYIAAFMFTAILINTKFTHFFYVGLIWIGFIALCIVRHHGRMALNLTGFAIGTLLVGVLILGWNPYITNIQLTGDPFYPLLSGNVDIMTGNTPAIYFGHGRAYNFLLSQFSTEGEAWGLFRHPTSVSVIASTTLDARTMGFGALYSVIFIMSVIMMIVSRQGLKGWLLYFLPLLMCFIFEQTWWARYVPMAWAPIGISVIGSYLRNRGRLLRGAMVVIVVVDLLLVGVRSNAQSVVGGMQWRYFLENAKGGPIIVDFKSNPAFRRHLDERDVKYVEISRDSMVGDRVYTIVGNRKIEDMPVYECDIYYSNNDNWLKSYILNYSEVER